MRYGLILLFALSACQGTVREPSVEPRAPSCGATPEGIVRLTRAEYSAALRQLLGPSIGSPGDALPADDSVSGLEIRGGRMVPLVAEQLYTIAEDASDAIELSALVTCTPSGAAEERACAEDFVARFGERAYRRPVTTDEAARLMSVYDRAESFEDGVRWTLAAMLVSPAFLYHDWGELGTPHQAGDPMRDWVVASRLSFFLYGEPPDAALRDIARQGGLGSAEQVAEVVEGMLADPRARQGLLRFFGAWLHTDHLRGVSKDPAYFPEFSAEVAEDLTRSLEAFIEHAVWEGGVNELFAGETVFLNERLASIYGATGVSGDDLVPVALDPANRLGLLGQPGIAAMLATTNQGHPIRRGVFVREHLLCDDLPSPPPGVDVAIPALDHAPTTRERFTLHAQAECRSCHQFIDPIGFALERYDGIGRVRETEGGHPIDDSGFVCAFPDCAERIEVEGPAELSAALADDPRVHACLAREWTRFALHASPEAIDSCEVERIASALSVETDLTHLVVAIATSDLFAGTPAREEGR